MAEDTASDAGSSAYSWNSEDEPPKELGGEEFKCTFDAAVVRYLLGARKAEVQQFKADPALLDRFDRQYRVGAY